MPTLVRIILEINEDIARRFEFDYLLVDALFLAIWIMLLIRKQRFGALKAGVICGIVFYVIDGVIWTASGVREYEMSAAWVKFPVDFMMDISYGIVGFGWAWLALERRSTSDVAFWTVVLFLGWLAIPFVSQSIHLIDDPITTVRHMSSRVWLHVAVVIAGYAALIALGYELKTVLYVFWVGCMLAFVMEFALLVSGIRSTNWSLLAYETLILTNQGIPYLYIIKTRILPLLTSRAAVRETARGSES